MTGSTDGTIDVRPGFVDLQVNGVDGVDFWTADQAGWEVAGAALLAAGTTCYLPTLPSAPLDAYAAALDRIAAARDRAEQLHLPHIAGVHLEGPFLGDVPGAHPPELIRPMDVEWLLALIARHPGLVRLVTLAPEADPGFDGIRALTGSGIVVALGHSGCDYATAVAAADAGARLVTHLFNGMRPRHHRAPTLADAALDPAVELTPTLIADGVHVHPAVVRALARSDFVLVTDAVATGGEYFGQRVSARDGAAYLADGTLTGSTLSMNGAVENLVAWGFSHDQALDRAVARPIRAGGLQSVLSSDAGVSGSRIALDRATLAVRDVWIAGEHVYGA